MNNFDPYSILTLTMKFEDLADKFWQMLLLELTKRTSCDQDSSKVGGKVRKHFSSSHVIDEINNSVITADIKESI